MAASLRVAYVGNGARLPAVLAGAVGRLAAGHPPVHIALADTAPDDAATLADYTGLVAARAGFNLTASSDTLPAALDGAQLVVDGGVESDGLPARAASCLDALEGAAAGGPGAVVAAVSGGAAFLALAREAARRCPGAPLVTLAKPPDVLAGAARRRFGHTGLRPVGVCGGVEALRRVLAMALGVAAEDVTLIHGGVHGLGWVARFAVAGRDGYSEYGEALLGLGKRADLPPEAAVVAQVYALTGLLPTSAPPGWPFVPVPAVRPGPAVPAPTCRVAALVAALRSGRPLARIPAAAAGQAVAAAARALGEGLAVVVPLQVPYAGEALGWSPEVTVEAPAIVTREGIAPVQVGPLPPGVDGLARMLGQQRALASDYLAGPDLATLTRALAATPLWGTPAQIRGLAEVLHAEFAPGLEAAVRP